MGKRGIWTRWVFGIGRCRAKMLRLVGLRVGSATVVLHRPKIIGPHGIVIGRSVFIGDGCVLDGRGGLRIGDRSQIAGYVAIHSVNHHVDGGRWIDELGSVMDAVTIEDGVWIGTHAVVLAGVTVGEGAVIGAGAVVTRDVPAFAVAVGNPARVVRMRNAGHDMPG